MVKQRIDLIMLCLGMVYTEIEGPHRVYTKQFEVYKQSLHVAIRDLQGKKYRSTQSLIRAL